MPELGHHSQVVADRDVLGVAPVAQPEHVAVPHRERPPGGRERDRAAAGREDNKRPCLRRPHPHVREGVPALGRGLDQLEGQVRERQVQPGAGGQKARHAGQCAGGRFVGGLMIDVVAGQAPCGELRVTAGQRRKVCRQELVCVHAPSLV